MLQQSNSQKQAICIGKAVSKSIPLKTAKVKDRGGLRTTDVVAALGMLEGHADKRDIKPINSQILQLKGDQYIGP